MYIIVPSVKDFVWVLLLWPRRSFNQMVIFLVKCRPWLAFSLILYTKGCGKYSLLLTISGLATIRSTNLNLL